MSKKENTSGKQKKGKGKSLVPVVTTVALAAVTLVAVAVAMNLPAPEAVPAPEPPAAPTQATAPPPTEPPASRPEPAAPSEPQEPSEPEPPPSEAEEEEPVANANARTDFTEPGMPMLVNGANPLPEGFDPVLREVSGGYYYDANAADALDAMMAAAARDGISLWIISAYRSTERQTNNFNNKVAEYLNLGYTREQAVAATAAYIAYPGTSEHSAGLAIDFNSLYEDFENTDAFAWLIENCADYGFILRYAKDKTDITKINYEPWHYRYVGSNHAKIIMEEGICLEEYWEKYGPGDR